MSKREKFITRSIVLLDDKRKDLAEAMVRNAPIGIEIVAREIVKARKLDQNALMWVGPLSDISRQAWVNGRQYSDVVWHEQFKREYLPEEDDQDLAELVKDTLTYLKWDYTPDGERVCVGSTTDLTIKGFSQYLEKVQAFGSSLGVLFSVSPRNSCMWRMEP